MAGSPRVGGYFAGGLTVSLLILALAAWACCGRYEYFSSELLGDYPLWYVRACLICIVKNQAQAILVALGLSVMFTLSVYLLQKSLVG